MDTCTDWLGYRYSNLAVKWVIVLDHYQTHPSLLCFKIKNYSNISAIKLMAHHAHMDARHNSMQSPLAKLHIYLTL
jgi:hypothetical protein